LQRKREVSAVRSVPPAIRYSEDTTFRRLSYEIAFSEYAMGSAYEISQQDPNRLCLYKRVLVTKSRYIVSGIDPPSDVRRNLLKNHILLNDDRSHFANSKRTDFQLCLGRWIRDGVSVFIIR
jgi:hypothetical protein